MCKVCETYVVFDRECGIIQVKVSKEEGRKLIRQLDGEIILIPLSEYDPKVCYYHE